MGTAVMVAGGTWACRWRELRPMSFGLGDGQGYEMAAVAEEEEEGETRANGEAAVAAVGGKRGGSDGLVRV